VADAWLHGRRGQATTSALPAARPPAAEHDACRSGPVATFSKAEEARRRPACPAATCRRGRRVRRRSPPRHPTGSHTAWNATFRSEREATRPPRGSIVRRRTRAGRSASRNACPAPRIVSFAVDAEDSRSVCPRLPGILVIRLGGGVRIEAKDPLQRHARTSLLLPEFLQRQRQEAGANWKRRR